MKKYILSEAKISQHTNTKLISIKTTKIAYKIALFNGIKKIVFFIL